MLPSSVGKVAFILKRQLLTMQLDITKTRVNYHKSMRLPIHILLMVLELFLSNVGLLSTNLFWGVRLSLPSWHIQPWKWAEACLNILRFHVHLKKYSTMDEEIQNYVITVFVFFREKKSTFPNFFTKPLFRKYCFNLSKLFSKLYFNKKVLPFSHTLRQNSLLPVSFVD